MNLLLDSMTFFFEFLLKEFMLEGQVENWIVIIDLNEIGIMGLPMNNLINILKYLSSNYRSRMYKCYVLNAPGSVSIPWSMLSGFIDESTSKKIEFNEANIIRSINSHCNLSQIQVRHGGKAPNLTED